MSSSSSNSNNNNNSKKNSNKKVMSTSFVDTITTNSQEQINEVQQQQQQPTAHHHYKIRLPSLKKLKNKLSIRKSHSSASNLNEISKLKITTSTSTQVIAPSHHQHQQQQYTTNSNSNDHYLIQQQNGSLQNLTTYYHNLNNEFSVIPEDQVMDTTTPTPTNSSSNSNDLSLQHQQQQQQQSKVQLRVNNNKHKNALETKKRISLPVTMKSVLAGGNSNTNNNNLLATSTLSINAPSAAALAGSTSNLLVNRGNLSASSSYIMKPLNRNSRRASMSELGYGKIESYKRLEKLGEGTYATVYKGESTINGSFVALKEIRLEHEEGAPCTAIREASLLRQLKHANIVTLHDIIYTEKALTLVFEYLEKDLKQYMDDCNNMMSIKNVKIFLFQLLRGLAYCHSRQILHRDLKPQNLLVNSKGELKLADFGLARAKSIPTKTYSHEVVTLWYRPPDVLLGSTDYSTHIDMWGAGCIFYEMVCGKALFPGIKVEDELTLIFRTLGTPTEQTFPGISHNPEYLALNIPKFATNNGNDTMSLLVPRLDLDGIDLLSSFLKYNPKIRVSASNALHHRFFTIFPEAVHKLDNNESIFDIPTIQLSKEPEMRFHNLTTETRIPTMYKL